MAHEGTLLSSNSAEKNAFALLAPFATKELESYERADDSLTTKFAGLMTALTVSGMHLASNCSQIKYMWLKMPTVLLAIFLFSQTAKFVSAGFFTRLDGVTGPNILWIWDKYGRLGAVDLVEDSLLQGVDMTIDANKKRQSERATHFNHALRSFLYLIILLFLSHLFI